jgi:hypothetical protein
MGGIRFGKHDKDTAKMMTMASRNVSFSWTIFTSILRESIAKLTPLELHHLIPVILLLPYIPLRCATFHLSPLQSQHASHSAIEDLSERFVLLIITAA